MSVNVSAPVPTDRIALCFRHKGWEVYGCDGYRAEIEKSGKKFRWRVWHVIGPQHIGSGRLDTRKAATSEAFRVLSAAAGIPQKVESSHE